MDKLVKAAQMAVNHQKTCQTCTKDYVCDIMAEINLNLVIAALR